MNIRKLSIALAVATAFPAASLAAVDFFDPVNGTPPPTLQALGVYSNISSKTADTAMKYFEVNAALWSDGAAKKRWVILPPGTHINYVDTTDVLNYPDGAMFVKNFYLDSIVGDTTTRRYWETRLLVNKEEAGFDKWYGFTYKWRKDQSNADLVSIANGLDTVFYYHPNGAAKPQTYKKWSFPKQSACYECHKQGTVDTGTGPLPARGVLGFLPVQLKRAAPLQPSINQVAWLANQGVFNPLPSNINYAARWKGINEPIPAGLPDSVRFAVIDSMARSYIAANCSGCHSPVNATVSSTPPKSLNYDWHDFKPRIEFGSAVWGALGLDVPVSPEDSLLLSDGRHKYLLAVEKAGMTGKGAWTMNFPPTGNSIPLINPGFAASSPLLYRQFAMRRPAWRDSISLREQLAVTDPANLKAWIFNNPWGSVAWRADLTMHGVKFDSLMQAHLLYAPDGYNPMPPLATNMPDTAAMRVLGEWAKNYRTLVAVEGYESVPGPSALHGKTVAARAEMPQLRNRMLIVPNGWSGKAQMFTLAGRAYALPSVGRGQYAIPQSAPVGVYYFRVGNRSFRASLLK